MSKESNVEKLGIRKGDIIERFNGEYISSTTEVRFFLGKMEKTIFFYVTLYALDFCTLLVGKDVAGYRRGPI